MYNRRIFTDPAPEGYVDDYTTPREILKAMLADELPELDSKLRNTLAENVLYYSLCVEPPYMTKEWARGHVDKIVENYRAARKRGEMPRQEYSVTISKTLFLLTSEEMEELEKSESTNLPIG